MSELNNAIIKDFIGLSNNHFYDNAREYVMVVHIKDTLIEKYLGVSLDDYEDLALDIEEDYVDVVQGEIIDIVADTYGVYLGSNVCHVSAKVQGVGIEIKVEFSKV